MRDVKKIISVLALGLACLVSPEVRAEEPQAKVALVIGNGAYRDHRPLETAGADTTAVAEALRALGFQVIARKDVSNGGFRAALSDFSRALRPGGIALFYYMGHALQIEGRNFMLPVGSRMRRATDRITLAIPLGTVLNLMERSRARANVVLLDAAYPDAISAAQPWSDPGLAAPDVRGRNSLIVLADWPDRVSPMPVGGSPFATELVAALAGPRPELSAVAETVANRLQARDGDDRWPWIGPGFTDRIVLGRETPETPETEPDRAPAADYLARAEAATGEQELVRPGVIPRTSERTQPQDPAKVETAVQKAPPDPLEGPPTPQPVPEGQARPESGKTLSQIARQSAQNPTRPAPSSETAFESRLSATERGRIQRDLRTLELYRGSADRIFGPGTRSGIRKLQAALNEPATGYLTEGQRQALAQRASERRKSIQVAKAAAERAVAAAERRAPAKATEPAATAGNSAVTQNRATAAPSISPSTPPAQQAAAPSNLPFGSAGEAETYLRGPGNLKARLQRYNRDQLILEHQGNFKIDYIDSLRVTQLEGDQIKARITFTVSSRRRSSSSGTFDFVLRWSGGEVEILSHARK